MFDKNKYKSTIGFTDMLFNILVGFAFLFIIAFLLIKPEAKKQDFVYEVIVINDGSTDNSLSLLDQNKDLYDLLITYEKNNGKGHAVLKGLEAAKGKYIIFQDADLEYDPKDFLKFINLINNFEPDLILGSRLNYSDFTSSHNILNKFGNMFITLIFNLFYIYHSVVMPLI